MGKKVDAPKPTDPKDTSAAATGTNVSTAIANAFLNNPSEYGPDGSRVVSQTGDFYEWRDPFTGKTYKVPTFRTDVTLSPEQQAIKQQQDAAKLNLSSLANQQSGFLQDYMGKPFSYDTNDHEKWSLGLYDKLNSDNIAGQQESLQTRLANQGITAGSEAYDKEMQAQTAGLSDSRNRFLLDSLKTGFGMAQSTRNQPINEITALMSGSQVSQPSWTGANMPTIPTTDNAGIIANYDQQNLNAWQLEQQQRNQMLNNFGGLFGGLSMFI